MTLCKLYVLSHSNCKIRFFYLELFICIDPLLRRFHGDKLNFFNKMDIGFCGTMSEVHLQSIMSGNKRFSSRPYNNDTSVKHQTCAANLPCILNRHRSESFCSCLLNKISLPHKEELSYFDHLPI